MADRFKYMIHFQGAPYANDLYGENGDHVYVLADAIKAAERFGKKGWEVYNGEDESENRFLSDAEDAAWPWCAACRSYHHPENKSCFLLTRPDLAAKNLAQED